MFKVKRYIKRHFYYPYLFFKHNQYAKTLKKKKEIKVVFFAMNVAMWKYQHLYELMVKNPRFKIYIVLSPANTYTKEQIWEDIKAMRNYFSIHKTSYIDWKIEEGEAPLDVRKAINPDILFYSQPYKNAVTYMHQYIWFKDKLICYYPYGYIITDAPWTCNLEFHHLLWKFFVYNKYTYNYVKHTMSSHYDNLVILGYPSVDDFFVEHDNDVWKNDERGIKRIIWAPHFTIRDSIKGFAPRSNFLWMADMMVDIARKNIGKIQLAFKPHPRLRSELYNTESWGVTKTDAYYKQWESMPNTQLETGDFVNLFRGSDAMIHDSGSFVVDYAHFYEKPVMFMSQDINIPISEVNQIGKDIYKSCYWGKNEEDIQHFIQDIVIGGEDTKKVERERVFHDYLEPQSDMTVAERAYNNIIQSLEING